MIDTEIIATYCRAVFRYVDGIVPVRVLAETGTPQKTPKQSFPDVEHLTSVLCDHAGQAADKGCGVYVVPCTVEPGQSARAENILQTCVIVIDLDKGNIDSKRTHASRHLGKPSLVIASGGITETGQQKCHLYWRLTEAATGADLERVRALRETLAVKLGGDPSFKSLAQPIRVAGTLHGKNGLTALVRTLEDNDLDYDLAELEDAAHAMPALEAPLNAIANSPSVSTGPGALDLAIRHIHSGGVDDVSRFEALSKVIGHWIRNVRRPVCTLDEAWCATRDHNAAMIVPPWDEARLHREFIALLNLDIKKNGPLPSAMPAGAEQDLAPDSSEDAIADRFASQHGADWKHVAQWGAWFKWTGQVWARDTTGGARELARMICRATASDCERPAEARRIASDRTIAASLRIAACDPRIATQTSDWDTHPLLLNTPTGIIDLQTGETLPHDPALLLTQMTTASAEGDCPLWYKFLGEITGGNKVLEAYLSRLAGYCLTGSTREQSFAFLHGDGANGKSVFLSTMTQVLGNYAATATLDTFMSVRGTRHLTELAGLRAARLVMVPETEQGQSWAEGRIKTVTGGEKIRANFMRQDHFEFAPQFKLLIAGNHRPHLSGCGEAMRRRLHLVPFDVTIPASRRDPQLVEKLTGELGGILRWMLDGCVDWQRMGLAPPDCVLEAVQQYFADEDLVGQWIAENCCEGPELRTTSKSLFSNWKSWAEQTGCAAGSTKSLGEALRQRGFRPVTVNRGRGWSGLALRHCFAAEEVAE
ncbi:phage/plasmid primase, P4 family [Roseovarius sp. Pro17]|uniref:phage/plasmid primase, P4 family n=1 Tax=Roseovarius sp. Pro17 TaxID=3108175 RepID=UPI002D769256|nr:phage/plasmid primase, P4 family [Roseovarius sp. Pro17]